MKVELNKTVFGLCLLLIPTLSSALERGEDFTERHASSNIVQSNPTPISTPACFQRPTFPDSTDPNINPCADPLIIEGGFRNFGNDPATIVTNNSSILNSIVGNSHTTGFETYGAFFDREQIYDAAVSYKNNPLLNLMLCFGLLEKRGEGFASEYHNTDIGDNGLILISQNSTSPLTATDILEHEVGHRLYGNPDDDEYNQAINNWFSSLPQELQNTLLIERDLIYNGGDYQQHLSGNSSWTDPDILREHLINEMQANLRGALLSNGEFSIVQYANGQAVSLSTHLAFQFVTPEVSFIYNPISGLLTRFGQDDEISEEQHPAFASSLDQDKFLTPVESEATYKPEIPLCPTPTPTPPTNGGGGGTENPPAGGGTTNIAYPEFPVSDPGDINGINYDVSVSSGGGGSSAYCFFNYSKNAYTCDNTQDSWDDADWFWYDYSFGMFYL